MDKPPAYSQQPGPYQQPYPAGQPQPYPAGQPYPPGQPQPYATGYAGQQSTVVVQQPATQTVIVGGCAACGGHISENFTACGVILAICFFPLGVLCCFLMMEKRCDRCGAHY